MVLLIVFIENLDDGMNGSLGKLAAIPNWGEQSMCYQAGLLHRGTWTGPEKGPCGGQGWSTGHTKRGGGTLGWFSLGKRRGRRDLSAASNWLVGGSRENGAKLLPVVNSNRMRCNEHDLEHRKSPLDIRKNCEGDQASEQGPESM